MHSGDVRTRESRGPDRPATPRSALVNVLPLSALLVVSAALMKVSLMRRWYPADSGTFSECALRILRGQLPHRDYIALYSEGLSYLHAVAFRIFPPSFSAERLVLFLCFLIWLPAVYVIARNYLRPWAAALVGLLAVCWSVPQYPESMPSWYCLFCATFGVLALIRFAKGGNARWLVVAGCFAGLSFLVKVVALYFVAAALLFFVYREQESQLAAPAQRQRSLSAYSWFVLTALVAFIGTLFALIHERMDAIHFIHFILPGVVLVLLLARRQWYSGGDRALERFRALFGMIVPFLFGLAAVVALGLIPYFRAGALGYFFRGVFVLPFRHVTSTAAPPPGFEPLLLSAGALAAVVGVSRLRGRLQRAVSVGLLAAFVAALAITISNGGAASMGWPLAEGVMPALVIAGVVKLFLLDRGGEVTNAPAARGQTLYLLLATCALCSLVQFPFYTEAYFSYVAPLTILALLAAQDSMTNRPCILLAGLAICFAILGFALLDAGRFLVRDSVRASEEPLRKMNLARAGDLEIPAAEAAVYERLVAVINGQAGDGEVIAGPDCPEVYVLSERANPTRDIFEFLHDPRDYRREIERRVDSGRVRVVVINHGASFSHEWAPILESAARGRYAHEEVVGNFEVRWK